MLPLRFHLAFLQSLALSLALTTTARAGGPKYIAGTSFFNPAVLGQPLHSTASQPQISLSPGRPPASASPRSDRQQL